MRLSVLKPGSKSRVKLGFCCYDPWTFSGWAEGDEDAYLNTKRQERAPSPTQRTAPTNDEE